MTDNENDIKHPNPPENCKQMDGYQGPQQVCRIPAGNGSVSGKCFFGREHELTIRQRFVSGSRKSLNIFKLAGRRKNPLSIHLSCTRFAWGVGWLQGHLLSLVAFKHPSLNPGFKWLLSLQCFCAGLADLVWQALGSKV